MVKPEKKGEPENKKFNPKEMKKSVSNQPTFNGINSSDIPELINRVIGIVLRTNEYNDTIYNILLRLFSGWYRKSKLIQYVNISVNKAGKLECCLSVDDSEVYKLNQWKLSQDKNAKLLTYDSVTVFEYINEFIDNINSIISKEDLNKQINRNSMSYYTNSPSPTKIYFSWKSNDIFGDYLENDSVKMFNYLFEYQKDIECPEYLKLPMIELLKDVLGEYISPEIRDGFNKLLKHDGANVIIYAKNAYAYDTVKDILRHVLKIPYTNIRNEDLNEEMAGIYDYPLKIKLLNRPVVYGDDKIYKKVKSVFDSNNEISKKLAENKRKFNNMIIKADEQNKASIEFASKVHDLAEKIIKGE